MRSEAAALTTILAAAATAAAQTCEPVWETAIGTPGIASGYVAPMTAWDDGSGEKLYIGGSFEGIGGTGINYLAAWESAGGTCSVPGGGIVAENTTFLAAIMPFDPGSGEQLVVGGAFGSAAGAPGTKSLAMWDGAQWSDLGSNLRSNSPDSVWALAEWDGVLFAAGNFPEIGGVTANNIASWDGSSWSALGSGIAGGYTFVPTMQVFDDGSGEKLYVAGRFSSVGGVSTGLIACWDGTNWSQVGGGLTPTHNYFGIESMVVFDDGSGPALFVGGHTFIPAGQSATNVAKWDGAQWTSIGQEFGSGRVPAMAVYDDGTGAELVVGGSRMPGIDQLAVLDGGVWVPFDGGVGGTPIPTATTPSVYGLSVYEGALYVGGTFSEVGTSAGSPRAAGGLAIHTTCMTMCYADCDQSTGAGVLDIFDFLCFQDSFVSGATYACDCDTTTGLGVCDIFDFLCFQDAFVAGCP